MGCGCIIRWLGALFIECQGPDAVLGEGGRILWVCTRDVLSTQIKMSKIKKSSEMWKCWL